MKPHILGEASRGVAPLTAGESGPPPAPPGPIGSLAVTAVTATTAQVAFTNAEYATSHQYRLDGGAWQALGSGRIISELTPGTTYAVQVRGRNAAGDGPPSNVAEIVTEAQAPEPPVEAVTAMVMGQSELEHIFSADSFFRQIPQPAQVGEGNLVVLTQKGAGVPPVRTVVDANAVAAGRVNPAMAAMSAFLDYVRPGRLFVVGDGAVSGTSRYGLADDTTDDTDDRRWADFASVVDAIEAEFGPVGHLVECWYSSDGPRIPTFRDSFWPFYFGANADGSRFELGSTVNSRQIDHCLFDASAAPGDKGRGIFTRDTEWHLLTAMPFHGAPTAPDELENFSAGSSTMVEPRRAILRALADDPLAQSVKLRTGPSAHVCRFGGASSDIHPSVEHRDGTVLFAWPVALALLRASGMEIGEPSIVGTEGPADGSYVDVLVDLPKGGDLTTLAALRGTADLADHPHLQDVTGFEITRAGGARRPVFRADRTERPASHRGTVEIVDAGSGTPRRGRIRITPQVPFGFGDTVDCYLRGQATASLQKPRDQYLYPWMLIEHVPALFDASATYPMEGIAVRPYQESLPIPVAPPSFTARGAYFDGTSYFASGSAPNIAAGSQGLLSVWIRNDDSAWNATSRRVFQFYVGTSSVLELNTQSAGRLTFRLANDSGNHTESFYAAPGNTQFQLGQWYHIAVAWTMDGLQVYVNGVLMASKEFTAFNMAGQTLTRMGVGASVAALNPWLGDLAHLYINLAEALDLSDPANVEKFIKDGAPVDLGANGQLPTGNAPAFYYDGDPWANQGTAGNIPLTGALTASALAPGR